MLLAGMALLAGCGEAKRQPAADAPVRQAEATPVLARPPVLIDAAERGEKGARNVLLEFARAIEMKRFGVASALLGPAGARWSEEELARVFAGMGRLTVAVGDGAMEGAAGSSYYAAPVVVTGADRDGRPVRIAGEAVVRRVNDVDGATAAQLRWHFQELRLDWVH
jgi:hypothetical protein